MDKICGNCGNPYSKHYFEEEIFCNDFTNGDVFTDEPQDYILISFIEENYNWVYKLMVYFWKKNNGHK